MSRAKGNEDPNKWLNDGEMGIFLSEVFSNAELCSLGIEFVPIRNEEMDYLLMSLIMDQNQNLIHLRKVFWIKK
jgi:hypothetical protein